MIIKMRPYGGADDLRRMADLVRAFPAGHHHVVDLPYRLSSWAFDYPQNVGLWEDDAGTLLAWAVLQPPFWTLDYAFHPDTRDYGMGPQILTWAIQRAEELVDKASGHPAWFLALREDQADQVGDAARAGFVPEDDWAQVYMERPAADPIPEPVLPPGFTLRPLAGASEVEAYADLHRAAFRSTNMTAEWRARTLQAPEYIPDLDLVIAAPDGRVAAFCVGWFLSQGPHGMPTGQVEPLGVHPDFQRQGLGRAVLAACLRRMVEHGATTLAVETDDYRDAAYGLYTAAGFQVAHRILMCRRNFGAAET